MLYVYWENIIHSGVKPIDNIKTIKFEKKGDENKYYEVTFGDTPLIFQIYEKTQKEISDKADRCFYDEVFILFDLDDFKCHKITYSWIDNTYKNQIVSIDIFLKNLPDKVYLDNSRIKTLRTYHENERGKYEV